jgi:NAD(P)-dependent dehydrogenase (short-subunit alcohol dehydrogenase family)
MLNEGQVDSAAPKLHWAGIAGKVALVCGSGAGGIGSATSRLLGAAGAKIVAVDRDPDLVQATVVALKAIDREVIGVVADLRDPEQVARIVPQARAAFGRIDLLANIAGGTQRDQWLPLEHTPDEVYKVVMALNLNYVFQICRDAATLMIEHGHGGAIVNISSISAFAAAPYAAIYGAAKRAVTALTQTMAVEWGPRGIRANVVSPGIVQTPRSSATAGDAMQARQREWAPLGRPVSADEIAQTILFLLSDQASAITGQSITVDCGVSAKAPGGSLEYYRGYSAYREDQ